MMEWLPKTNVIDYEYVYYENARVWVFRKQTYSSMSTITLECNLDHHKGDLRGISLFHSNVGFKIYVFWMEYKYDAFKNFTCSLLKCQWPRYIIATSHYSYMFSHYSNSLSLAGKLVPLQLLIWLHNSGGDSKKEH